tara:strand:- start:197 stop:415 length:219 start_codon:yes stop_codon:yes gene_type:complete
MSHGCSIVIIVGHLITLKGLQMVVLAVTTRLTKQMTVETVMVLVWRVMAVLVIMLCVGLWNVLVQRKSVPPF